MGDGLLALTWNNHNTTFVKTLSVVRIKEKYTDVTLSCDGRFYQLHKLMLSTCSEYFEKIFEQTPCKHPVIVLRDVSCEELEALLNYMYLGSVSVAQNDLARLIKVAELFQIKGLAVPDEPPKNSDSDALSSKKTDTRDRTSSQRTTTVPETNRTRPSASDSSDVLVPKRSRTSENYASSDRASTSKDRSRLDNTNRSQENRSGNSGSDTPASTSIEESSFPVRIKEEVIEEENSEFADLASFRRGFDSSGDPDPGGAFDPLSEEAQLASVFIPKAEPKDVPPEDEPSVSESGMEENSYAGEDIIGLPGPSDAQGWYSEGDSSCGLPGAEGSIGDESQEMHPMMTSQQQPQGQAQQSHQQQPPMVLRGPFVKSRKWRLGDLRLFRCHICGYSTKNRTHLQHHSLIHTGEKPYVCSFCPASFTFKGSMKRHERTHTGEKPFACSHCHYSSNQRSSLLVHMQRHHSKNV